MTIRSPTRSGRIARQQSSGHEERHNRAVAQTLSWANEAAAREAFDDALQWLRTVEVVDGELSQGWQRTKTSWRLMRVQQMRHEVGTTSAEDQHGVELSPGLETRVR